MTARVLFVVALAIAWAYVGWLTGCTLVIARVTFCARHWIFEDVPA